MSFSKPPWQDLIVPFLNLDTELGASARAKAAEIFPPGHPMNNVKPGSGPAFDKEINYSSGAYSIKEEEEEVDNNYYSTRKDEDEIIFNTPQTESDAHLSYFERINKQMKG